MIAFFSLLFYASSLLPFFPFFLSFHPSYLPTFHPYDTIPRTVHTILCDAILLYIMQYHTHIPMSTNIHDLGFVLHSLLLFAHTLSIFISLSLVTVTLYILYIYI